ncbi:MAG: dihydrodipicolinate synthase family protein [Planctomycetota bacterium]
MPDNTLSNPLGTGVIPPLVTPWTDDQRLDEAGLERLIESLINGGVHGLFVLGTTGEGPALPMTARRQIVSRCVAVADGRVPVLVGATDSCVESVFDLADHSAAAGAAAVVVAPPPYSPLDIPELNHYLDHLSERLPLPMFLYNIPSRTGPVPMASVRHALSLPDCIGFKDSSGSMIYLHEALQLRDELRPEFRVLVGPEELLAESVLFGADGGVAGGANLFPELFVEIYEAAKRKDIDTAIRLHRTIIRFSTTLYRSGQHPSSFIKAVKRGLTVRGICHGNMVNPYEAFNTRDTQRVDQLIREADTWVNQALQS